MFGIVPVLALLLLVFLAIGMLELAVYGLAFLIVISFLMYYPTLVALVIAVIIIKKVLD